MQKAPHKQFLLINTKVGFTLDVGKLLSFGFIRVVLRGIKKFELSGESEETSRNLNACMSLSNHSSESCEVIMIKNKITSERFLFSSLFFDNTILSFGVL